MNKYESFILFRSNFRHPKSETSVFTGFGCPKNEKTAWDSGTWDNDINKYQGYKNKSDTITDTGRNTTGRECANTMDSNPSSGTVAADHYPNKQVQSIAPTFEFR